MSYAGLGKAAEGVSVLSDANSVAQMVKTLGEIDLVSANFKLYGNFDDLLARDANNIFADSTDPDNSGQVAVDETQKEMDTNRSDQANGTMNTLVEGRKQVISVFGNNLTDVFSSIEPIKSLLSFFTGVIAKKL